MGAHTTDLAEMWLVMELLERVSVGGLLAKHAHIPMVRRIYIARDCADGMAFLHSGQVQIIHRDLKVRSISKNWLFVILALYSSPPFSPHKMESI